jgi:hypothetical protein
MTPPIRAASPAGERPAGARRLDRASLLDAAQRHLAPQLTREEIESRWRRSQEAPLDEKRGFDPFVTLNALRSGSPLFYEDLEAPLLDAEDALFSALEQDPPAEAWFTRRVRQVHRLRTHRLPPRSALHLSLPVPRSVAGVQEVRLLRAHPEPLLRCYLPEAGLMHDVRVLVGYPGGPPTIGMEIELEFEVRQSRRGLAGLKDPWLFGRTPSPPLPGSAVEEWQRAFVAAWSGPDVPPDVVIDALLAEMERRFRYAITGPPRDSAVGALFRIGAGDIHTLSHLSAWTLDQIGFAARVDAAQPLQLGSAEGSTTLRYPDSYGHEHRFVQWTHRASGRSGVFDLTYFRRWHFAATERNTRTEAFRDRLLQVGRRARSWLARGVYPLDLVLSGRSLPARTVHFDAGAVVQTPHCFADTEITVRRTDER